MPVNSLSWHPTIIYEFKGSLKGIFWGGLLESIKQWVNAPWNRRHHHFHFKGNSRDLAYFKDKHLENGNSYVDEKIELWYIKTWLLSDTVLLSHANTPANTQNVVVTKQTSGMQLWWHSTCKLSSILDKPAVILTSNRIQSKCWRMVLCNNLEQTQGRRFLFATSGETETNSSINSQIKPTWEWYAEFNFYTFHIIETLYVRQLIFSLFADYWLETK